MNCSVRTGQCSEQWKANFCSMSTELEKKLERKFLNSLENRDILTTKCKQLALALYWIEAMLDSIWNQ